MRTLITSTLAGALLLASGCVEDKPPRQTTTPRVEMTGTVTAGFAMSPAAAVVEASARGSVGRLRTAFTSRSSLQYAVSLVDLDPPYALTALVQDGDSGARGYTVAVTQGTANITPLTTLLVAQLYGQDPATVFQGFTPGGGAEPARVSTASLQEAQARLRAFVQEELDLVIPATVGDFVTASFQPVAGDTMYDSITSLLARLEELDLTLPEFTTTVAQAARQCITERVQVTGAGAAAEFCPASKSATPADDDADLISYVFTDRHGNELGVLVDGDAVLSARFAAVGAPEYLCAGAQCTAITLGAPAGDLTRPISFGNLVLSGDAGTLTVNGSLTGAIPGVVLPVLPCDSNRFFVVLEDRSVVASCVDPDQYGFGIGAYLGDFQGAAPSRVQFHYGALEENDATRPQVSLVTDANDAVLAVRFVDYEPGTYTPRREFVCRLDACNGVSLGDVTENSDALGVPILIRTVTFQNTVLTGVDEDGNPTGGSVELIAALNTAWLDWVEHGFVEPIVFPSAGSCAPGAVEVGASADGTDAALCLTQTGSALALANGDVQLVAGDSSTDRLQVLLRGGEIVHATASFSNRPLVFICNGSSDCDGIAISPPDGDGRRTLQFDSAILYESLIGRLAGTRSLSLGGGPVTFDAEIPWP